VSKLDVQNAKLLEDNVKLMKYSYLKSFENEKALVRFLKGSKTSKSFTENNYASDACVSMMEEARASGYWMGIMPINTSNENIWSSLISNYPIKWSVFNVAIVGDADIYMVNPMEVDGYYSVMTMGGDFKNYYDMGKDEAILRYDGLSK
jgi:hypothetical protein